MKPPMPKLSRRSALLMTAGLAGSSAAGASLAQRLSAQTAPVIRAAPFPLDQVRLKPSLFLTAVETNQTYLLSVDPDRLLHNFRAGSGLAPKAPAYGGWEARGIAGHSLGHYQSAVALMYAQTGLPVFRDRALYITGELAACQAKDGDGYAGGTTVARKDKNGEGKTIDGKIVYEELRKGQIDTSAGLNGGWVPIYTYHKVMAGALDAHLYCDDAQSLQVAIGLAGYLGGVFEALDDAQVQTILSIEHGGISETYAELYARTGDKRWLNLALRVRHHDVLDPLRDGRDDLAGKHANTQIPKLIGLARTYEIDPNPEHAQDHGKTTMFFWETVTKDHSYVIGGNSEYEHFGPPLKLADKLSQQTCECCNSYNMLKLTRHLYGWTGEARYFDFYERAHLNHIMSQQAPDTGMFTYFSPLASGFARVHSTPDTDWWCCHGTGMENHAKHGDSIWWREKALAGDRVVVNLFYPSTLDWREKGVVLDMETGYPYADTITLRATKAPKPVDIALRIPAWCETPAATLNGHAVTLAPKDGYLPLTLKAGDVVALTLPMPVYSETMPDDNRLVAYLSGPLVLAADLGPASQPWDSFDPVVVNDINEGVLVKTNGDQAFTFAAHSRPQALTLRPFFAQHHNRTAVYFRRFTAAEWPAIEASYAADAREKADTRARTTDIMRLGEQQPEADHNFKGTNNTIDTGNLTVRNRLINNGWFQFELATAPGPLSLQVTYDGSARDKDFDILIDEEVLAHETLSGPRTSVYNIRQYRIPVPLTQGKSRVTVRFEGHHDQWAAVYEARLIKEKTNVA